MKEAVLLIGHGSRASQASEAMEQIAREIGARSGRYVATGYMELSEPTIEQALDSCAASGASSILMVPYFLHCGMHIREDIPKIIADARRLHPGISLTFGPPIGYHPALAEIIMERVAETALLAGADASRISTREPLMAAGSEIEKKSFEIIEAELGPHNFTRSQFAIVRRVIHATGDFEYAKNAVFSAGAVDSGLSAIRAGLPIVTDVAMVQSGIVRREADRYAVDVRCYMADPNVSLAATSGKTTRAVQAMRTAASKGEIGILAIGNAPTALREAIALIRRGEMSVRLIVGAPVGFVAAEESKEELIALGHPHIVFRGRKGGSSVAAAAVNALLKLAPETQ